MEIYRLSKIKYSHELSGIGAAKEGARWNSIGVEMVYTAHNKSLAMAEVAVHFSLANMPSGYNMLTIYLPDDIPVKEISLDDLPEDWNVFPHSEATKKIGDEFVNENSYCVLKVPSAVTDGDYNYLLNSKHKDFGRIKIIDSKPFPLDKRIFK